jgi:MFS family permease
MRWRTLAALALAELLAISPWFSGTAVLPELQKVWSSDLSVSSWLTIAVQLGFVLGALVSAATNLADVFSARAVLVVSALLAAGANTAFGTAAGEGYIAAALLARFFTGFFLAGVYPTGMKLLAGWFKEGRGLALGVMVGALSIGTALPYAMKAVPRGAEIDWRFVVNASSVAAVMAALLVAFTVREGPFAAPSPPFDFRMAGETFRDRRLRLANLGYLGHMWELYAMWGWLGVILLESRFPHGWAGARAAFVAASRETQATAFGAVAIGVLGCVLAGVAADRGSGARIARRANVTIVAMAASGACCVLGAVVLDDYTLFVAVAMVWGFSVVADSAQFSAIVSEVSDPRYVGTALTMQTATGFALTAVSLQFFGWMLGRGQVRAAIALLALGPALGIWAMWRLKRLNARPGAT